MNDRLSWIVTYISNACDSSMPRHTLRVYAYHMSDASAAAYQTLAATHKDGVEIIAIQREGVKLI